MSYAETQDEIIEAQLRRRPGPRVVSRPTALPPRVLPAEAVRLAHRRAAGDGVAAGPGPERRTSVPPRSDDDAEADLAAAVAAARNLRFMADVDQIIEAAGVTLEQLRGRGRERVLMDTRRIVAAYLRRRGCSLPEIGRVLGRDHTSVLNVLRTRARLADASEELPS